MNNSGYRDCYNVNRCNESHLLLDLLCVLYWSCKMYSIPANI